MFHFFNILIQIYYYGLELTFRVEKGIIIII